MAYMSQETKAKLAPAIKEVLKKYGMKGTIGVKNHSTLVCNIKSGKIDLIGNMYDIAIKKPKSYYDKNKVKPTYMQVNEFSIKENYSETALDFMMDLKEAMNLGNHDNSDIQSDCFDIGWYLSINVGNWDKPYQYIN
ncbi:hypothetical protein GW796_07420 [archaeon]|nr:hypothetical protein [archaeon]